MNAEAGVEGSTSNAARYGRPEFADLMERAYVVVAVGSPTRPTRSKVEWLVGDWERGARAIDALLSQGFLKEIRSPDGEARLALGDRRWPVRLPGERSPHRAGETRAPAPV